VTQVLIILVLAFVAANLPFMLERRLFVLPPPETGKSLVWRLLELVLMYFTVGGIAWLVEKNLGPVHPQHWEFYATTACLFLVFAYPGFVYRFLWRRKGAT
jgi:Na+(H+)/acetate symporter ActP